MKGHGAKYDRKKEEAIAALLTQKNIEEAARSIGVGHATLLRWLKEPEFDTAYRKPVGLHSVSQSPGSSRPLAQPLRPFSSS